MTEYPLRDSKADELLTHSGRPLSDITADAIAAGQLTGDDLRTHADTLRTAGARSRARAAIRSWPPICGGQPN